MRKTASNHIRHIWELRDIHVAFFFNVAVINHIHSLLFLFNLYACLAQNYFGKVAKVFFPMQGDGYGAAAFFSKNVMGRTDPCQFPSVFSKYFHYFPCRHNNNIQHICCNIKRFFTFFSKKNSGLFSGFFCRFSTLSGFLGTAHWGLFNGIEGRRIIQRLLADWLNTFLEKALLNSIRFYNVGKRKREWLDPFFWNLFFGEM